jgi:hypothetical protein
VTSHPRHPRLFLHCKQCCKLRNGVVLMLEWGVCCPSVLWLWRDSLTLQVWIGGSFPWTRSTERLPENSSDSRRLWASEQHVRAFAPGSRESRVCHLCHSKGTGHRPLPQTLKCSPTWVLFSHKPERQNFPWRQALRRISMQPCHEQKLLPQAQCLYFLLKIGCMSAGLGSHRVK